MPFDVFRTICYGIDVNKSFVVDCIGITDSNMRTEYKTSRFSTYKGGLLDLAS